MRPQIKKLSRAAVFAAFALQFIWGSASAAADPAVYRLGPDDQISIRVVDLDKLQLDRDSAPRVNVNGDLDLPIIGFVHAAGLTLDELKSAIAAKLSNTLNNPSVSVSIVQYRNHPVSVLGAVRNPGVFQVAQSKNLLEVLSLAGGMAPEAGDKIKISRLKTAGPLPLPNVRNEPDAEYQVGTIDVRSLTSAADTSLNFKVVDGDIISVSKAELIFVMGAVKRSGGYTLGDRAGMSVLQAISLAEGFDRTAAPRKARLLRETKVGQERTEIALDLKPILAGTAPDFPLQANDILFVPTSSMKVVSYRSIETAVQIGTGFAIYK